MSAEDESRAKAYRDGLRRRAAVLRSRRVALRGRQDAAKAVQDAWRPIRQLKDDLRGGGR